MERKQATKGHSLPGEVRGQDQSGHGKKVSQQEALTLWRGQRLGLVRTKKTNLARGTHKLGRLEVRTGQKTKRKRASKGTHSQERSEVRTGQYMKKKQASKEHLHTREVRGQDWLEYEKKPI